MTFSSHTEIQTFRALRRSLAPLGYDVSQKPRVLDCVRATAQNPQPTTPVGPTLGEAIVPALRSNAGPLGPSHPWLHVNDLQYAFKAHFDFVIHESVNHEHYPTAPLFAVEFDGSTHAGTHAEERDRAKNRLCAASGLPLVRIDSTYLHQREQLSTIEWIATLWHAYRHRMPKLIEERDLEYSNLNNEEASDPFVLGMRPDLDVELIFQLEYPFPPAVHLAKRLIRRYGMLWSDINEICHQCPTSCRWNAARVKPASPLLSPTLVQRWTCDLTLTGPEGKSFDARGIADVQTGYPIDEGPIDASFDSLIQGRMPWLPAGPWATAPTHIGNGLCLHNTLIDIESHLKRCEHQ